MFCLYLLCGLALTATAFMPSDHEDITYTKYKSVHLTNATDGFPQPLLQSKRIESPEQIAREAISMLIGEGDWRVLSSYVTKHNQLTHLAFKQYINDVECSNCDVTVNVNNVGQVLNLGYTYAPASLVQNTRKNSPAITPIDAIDMFASARIPGYQGLGEASETAIEGTEHTYTFPTLAKLTKSTGEVNVALQYRVSEEQDGTHLSLAWRVQMETEVPQFSFIEEWMDVVSGDSVAVIDHVRWAAGGTYEVYPIPTLDPLMGERSVLTAPADTEASPLAWHDQGIAGTKFTTTEGNNAYAQENWDGTASWENNYRPTGGEGLKFEFPVDFNIEPKGYVDAAITNLFFWNNLVHDVFWLAGFDEAAGNFQENNFGLGGLGGDAVQANAQDGAGFNNANMLTRADGTRGRMRMYLWNQVTPMIDGDFDSGIIVHEYGHGISTRMTGGPANVACLPSGQPGGMGEGWGDWWAIMFMAKATDTHATRFPMGIFAAGRGIRPYDYTFDMTVNPQTFAFLNEEEYSGVHAIGSVWCSILFDVYWEVRDVHGFDADWYRGKSGNNALFQNVVDGLKLQPCLPDFIAARDAILLADSVNFGGKHSCEMWRGFARRGLGYSATHVIFGKVDESFDMPPNC